jgi:hypothetical protein
MIGTIDHPPVCAPKHGYPVTKYDLWPGDVLIKQEEVHLIVDVGDEGVICYDVANERYWNYHWEFIEQDIERNTTSVVDEVVAPPEYPDQ